MLAINLNRVRGDRSPYRLVVREGDTLRSLSELLEVEPAALRAANPNVDLDELVPGMELMIPESSVIEIDQPAEASVVTEDEPYSDESADLLSGRTISITAGMLAQELGQTVPTETDPDDDEAQASAVDEAGDLSENEQSVHADQNEQAADEIKPQEDTQQSAASEQQTADVETPRPRYETISWKPFPKI